MNTSGPHPDSRARITRRMPHWPRELMLHHNRTPRLPANGRAAPCAPLSQRTGYDMRTERPAARSYSRRLVLPLWLVVTSLAPTSAWSQAGTIPLDSAHSPVVFSVQHSGAPADRPPKLTIGYQSGKD